MLLLAIPLLLLPLLVLSLLFLVAALCERSAHPVVAVIDYTIRLAPFHDMSCLCCGQWREYLQLQKHCSFYQRLLELLDSTCEACQRLVTLDVATKLFLKCLQPGLFFKYVSRFVAIRVSNLYLLSIIARLARYIFRAGSPL